VQQRKNFVQGCSGGHTGEKTPKLLAWCRMHVGSASRQSGRCSGTGNSRAFPVNLPNQLPSGASSSPPAQINAAVCGGPQPLPHPRPASFRTGRQRGTRACSSSAVVTSSGSSPHLSHPSGCGWREAGVQLDKTWATATPAASMVTTPPMAGLGCQRSPTPRIHAYSCFQTRCARNISSESK